MGALTDRAFDKGVPGPTERRLLPPFTDEHEQLRESIRRFVATELRPHAQRVGGRRAGSPTTSSRGWPSSASSG